jgi:hypothetical protein
LRDAARRKTLAGVSGKGSKPHGSRRSSTVCRRDLIAGLDDAAYMSS